MPVGYDGSAINTFNKITVHALKNLIFVLCAAAVLHPALSTVLSLALGLICGLLALTPMPQRTSQLSGPLLKLSIILLGFTVPLSSALEHAANSLPLTVTTIVATLALALLLGKVLRTRQRLSWLLASGTAICGGSAIAAVAPVVSAKKEEIAIALAIVFVLNALGLVIFPFLGQWLALSDMQFGIWSALAIHDTSSVVGAAAAFSDNALQIATPVKLARALWIIPLVIGISLLQTEKGWRDIKLPWFIAGFITTSALTLWPPLNPLIPSFALVAKSLLKLSLFVLGAAINVSQIKALGARPLIQALLLWAFVAILTLLWILFIQP